ncbi:hypothetical protein EIP91_010863 [Steccherinum ochraceum]|uniref:Uncharacterized protein n=1 Tax=Steccherinum ochraceum TaxID=92696 RepID=A0A4R0R5C9_9APHY|nr:hypothetical protein EIP91_010863 [Steccherinum ochraceum]
MLGAEQPSKLHPRAGNRPIEHEDQLTDYSDPDFQEAIQDAIQQSLLDIQSAKDGDRRQSDAELSEEEGFHTDASATIDGDFQTDDLTLQRTLLVRCEISAVEDCDSHLNDLYSSSPFLLDMDVTYTGPVSTVLLSDALQDVDFDITRAGRDLVYRIRRISEVDENLFNLSIANVDQFIAMNHWSLNDRLTVSVVRNYVPNTVNDHVPVSSVSFGFVQSSGVELHNIAFAARGGLCHANENNNPTYFRWMHTIHLDVSQTNNPCGIIVDKERGITGQDPNISLPFG